MHFSSYPAQIVRHGLGRCNDSHELVLAIKEMNLIISKCHVDFVRGLVRGGGQCAVQFGQEARLNCF